MQIRMAWRDIPAGVPQGTKLEPWLFLLMIDDINITKNDTWKFVNDTTMAECVGRGEVCTIQNAVTEFSDKAHACDNKFLLNESKYKELQVSFAKTDPGEFFFFFFFYANSTSGDI